MHWFNLVCLSVLYCWTGRCSLALRHCRHFWATSLGPMHSIAWLKFSLLCRCSVVYLCVCLSVCLVMLITTVSHAKTTEPIGRHLVLGLADGNHALDGDPDPPGEGQLLFGGGDWAWCYHYCSRLLLFEFRNSWPSSIKQCAELQTTR